jgi:type 1 glutamine amidotransferase
MAALAALAAGAVIASAQGQRPLDVLLVTGGHGFEREPFLQVFRDNADIAFSHAEHAKTSATAYERDDLFTYDVVVLYDMPASITEAQKARFLAFLNRGKGLVVLHHALVAYQDWPEYERIVGGRYPEPDPARPGLVTEQVGYEHDVEIPIVVAARDHPVTAGMSGFTIRDEIYWGFRVGQNVTPLLTTTHPKSGKPLAWTRTEGRSRVVVIQPGHGSPAFANAEYRRLLARSIRWASGQRPETGRAGRD